MKDLQIFKNNEFGEIRTIEKDGVLYFVAKDISTALGYSETSSVVRRLDPEDFISAKLAGMNMSSILINESGLYSAILGSQLPTAKGFKRWVTSEVLPSIRKTGSYSARQLPSTYKQALIELVAKIEETEQLEQANKCLAIELGKDKEWYSIKRVAMINNVNPKSIKWKPLKDLSIKMDLHPKKVFDQNYGFVNVYHENVWAIAFPQYEL